VPKRRRREWLYLVAAVVVFVGGPGYLVENEAQANTRFEQAHGALTRTERDLAIARSDLAAMRGGLSLIDRQVHQSATDWATDTTQLHQIESALTQAQANVSTQGSDIAALQSCLGGVEQALNALSVGDQQTAVGALTKVSSSCQGAVKANG
jgi:chromosome segregation ATPase